MTAVPHRPVRIVIIDDEPLARTRIARLVQDREDFELVGEFGRSREALLGLEELEPDLVFLDIQMPEMNGFELLEALEHEAPPVVIFVTAHAEHALRAFEVQAMDYLLKPFDNERFERTLARAVAKIHSEDAVGLRSEILRLVKEHWLIEPRIPEQPSRVGSGTHTLDRIIVRDGERIYFLKMDDIDWIEAADYNVRIHSGGQVHQLRETLTSIEERLDPLRFARIHRSALVNVDRIKELQPYFNGAYVVILHDGTELKLSRRRREVIEDLLGRSL